MPKYYAVRNGRNPGVYCNWDDCRAQTDGYSNAKFKSFDSTQEAYHFINGSHSSHSFNYSNPSVNYRSEYRSDSSRSGSSTRFEDMLSVGQRLEIYTDGACSNNGYGAAKAGIGVHFPDCPQNDISEPLSGRQTNNRAEIKAVVRGLEKAKQMGRNTVRINTDSQFLHSSVNEWQHKWKSRGWKKSDGTDVINKDDFRELEEASKGMDIQWQKVAAHKGIPGNEEADRLANKGVQNNRF